MTRDPRTDPRPGALSPTMLDALKQAAAHDGKLERRPGGYWVYPGVALSGSRYVWWAGTTTVHALVTRGAMAYTKWQQRNRSKGGGDFPVEATIIRRGPDE